MGRVSYHMASAAMDFYHGANETLLPGTRLTAIWDGWEHLDQEVADVEELLDRWRPAGAIARDDCVFLSASPEGTQKAGGGPVIHAVRPDGEPQASDLGWYGAFDRRLSEAVDRIADEGGEWDDADGLMPLLSVGEKADLRRLAAGYWSGRAHGGSSLMEYRAPSATIVSAVEDAGEWAPARGASPWGAHMFPLERVGGYRGRKPAPPAAPGELPKFNRTPRPVTAEMEAGLRRLGWDDFDRISRRGELRRDVLERKVADGEVSAEDAEKLIREDDLSYYINELTTDFQMAEHERLRQTWDSLSYADKRQALRDLTPPPELRRRTYESLRERGKVS